MTSSYRDRLFASYNETHIQHVDPADRQKLEWFREYAARNHLPHLRDVSPETAVVREIGCNKGYLLAVLAAAGGSRNRRPLDARSALREDRARNGE